MKNLRATIRYSRFPVLFCLVVMIALSMGCNKGPSHLDPDKVEWDPYYDPDISVEMQTPSTYAIEVSNNGSIKFRYKADIPVQLLIITEAEGKKKKLWFDEIPIEESDLGGVPGQKYVYSHISGISSKRYVAYVIPYNNEPDTYMAFIVRVDNNTNELDEVHKYMRNSLYFR